MRKFVIFSLVVFTYAASAQKIKTSEYDKFTKSRRIQTTAQWLKNGLGGGYYFALRSNDTIVLAQFVKAPDPQVVVGDKSSLIFLLDNDSTVSAFSKGIQAYTKGLYEYEISLSSVKQLTKKPCVGIRMYTASGYVNHDVPKKNQADIQKVCEVFLKEYEKQ